MRMSILLYILICIFPLFCNAERLNDNQAWRTPRGDFNYSSFNSRSLWHWVKTFTAFSEIWQARTYRYVPIRHAQPILLATHIGVIVPSSGEVYDEGNGALLSSFNRGGTDSWGLPFVSEDNWLFVDCLAGPFDASSTKLRVLWSKDVTCDTDGSVKCAASSRTGHLFIVMTRCDGTSNQFIAYALSEWTAQEHWRVNLTQALLSEFDVQPTSRTVYGSFFLEDARQLVIVFLAHQNNRCWLTVLDVVTLKLIFLDKISCFEKAILWEKSMFLYGERNKVSVYNITNSLAYLRHFELNCNIEEGVRDDEYVYFLTSCGTAANSVTTIYVLNKASALERTLTGVHKFYPPLAISKDLLFAKSRVEGESLGNLVVYDKKTGDSVFSWKPNCDIKSVALHNENILVASECESSGTTSLRINVLQLSLDVAFLVAIVSASVGGASFILGCSLFCFMKHKQTQSATHNSAPTAATARYVADAERVRIALSLPTPLDEPPPSYVVTDSVPSRDNDGITIIHEEEPDERPPSYEMSVEGRERPVSCDDEVF